MRNIDFSNSWLVGIDLVATGRQLREFRLRNDLTQDGLSAKFDFCDTPASRVSISMWENGKQLPSLSHIAFLAELYECSLGELVITYRYSRRGAEYGGQPASFLFCRRYFTDCFSSLLYNDGTTKNKPRRKTKMKKTIFKKLIALVLTVMTLLTCIAIPASAASSVKVKTGKYFTIYNVGSGKYLNVYGNQNKNNANVDVYAKDGTSGQAFKFTLVNGSYTLTPLCATSRRVNVYGDYAKNGCNVCLWSATKHSTQGWIIEAVSGGYILRSANNKSLVLTATGSKNSSNVNIQTYKAGNKFQIWQCDAFSTTSVSSSSANTSAAAKTLSLNWSILAKTGQQTYSGPCFCFALAYCRDIIDGRTHNWTEYRYGDTDMAVPSSASYKGCWGSTKAEVFKVIYNQIKAGKPCVVCVSGGRSTGEHYVCVVGYKQVTDVNYLSESNFIILDPVKNTNFANQKTECLGDLGYVLKSESQGYYYCIAK